MHEKSKNFVLDFEITNCSSAFWACSCVLAKLTTWSFCWMWSDVGWRHHCWCGVSCEPVGSPLNSRCPSRTPHSSSRSGSHHSRTWLSSRARTAGTRPCGKWTASPETWTSAKYCVNFNNNSLTYDVGHERVFGVGLGHEQLHGCEESGQVERRLPRAFRRHFQAVQTNPASAVDVGMVDGREES